jgi:hypothetical protein
VRVVERGCGASFLEEAVAAILEVKGFGCEKFDCYYSVESFVVRLVDGSHTARAQWLDYSVMSNRGSLLNCLHKRVNSSKQNGAIADTVVRFCLAGHSTILEQMGSISEAFVCVG